MSCKRLFAHSVANVPQLQPVKTHTHYYYYYYQTHYYYYINTTTHTHTPWPPDKYSIGEKNWYPKLFRRNLRRTYDALSAYFLPSLLRPILTNINCFMRENRTFSCCKFHEVYARLPKPAVKIGWRCTAFLQQWIKWRFYSNRISHTIHHTSRLNMARKGRSWPEGPRVRTPPPLPATVRVAHAIFTNPSKNIWGHAHPHPVTPRPQWEQIYLPILWASRLPNPFQLSPRDSPPGGLCPWTPRGALPRPRPPYRLALHALAIAWTP